ncbi:MAG: hypothetical protein E6H08_06435 [Bacteroidetes bacterium]|nr:MAG: hypothetical protein E6H08_06435 [Bacteroidota bacterium]
MKYSAIILSTLTVLLFSCMKEPSLLSDTDPATSNSPKTPTYLPVSKSILVDASKDGGVWWFPQGPSTGYSATNPHQGTALADYFRNLGYQVDELPRGAIITTELLDRYSKVIRPSAFFSYSPEEIKAYTSFLNRPSSLLLASDHMMNTVNDQLSASLGLMFEGAYNGPITSFQPHAITSGVASLDYIAGSVLKSWDPSKITVLGYQAQGVAAMGIVHHPSSRIFFIGDANGIELVPQPFISNLNSWLFK